MTLFCLLQGPKTPTKCAARVQNRERQGETDETHQKDQKQKGPETAASCILEHPGDKWAFFVLGASRFFDVWLDVIL
eukprot:4056490-Amphidinium_carterae.1